VAKWRHQAVLYAAQGTRRERETDEEIDLIIARTDRALVTLQSLAERMSKGEL
jgi:hypothetical protein